MKKTIFYSLLISILLLSFSCSREDDSSTSNENKQKLIGKWYFADPATYGYSTNNSFTFTSDGKVTYSYWAGGSGSGFDSETGTYSVEGDVLRMVYSQNVTLTFVQKVVFLTDKKVQFIETGKPNEEPYDGTYYKVN